MSLHATLPFTHGAHIELCYKYHYMSVLLAEKGMQLLPPVVVTSRSDSVVVIIHHQYLVIRLII